MAPELFASPPQCGPRSDLYALGVTLACLLLHADPFPSGSFASLRDWACDGPRPSLRVGRPDLPAALAALVNRLMSPRPSDRPSGAAEALATLSGVEPASLAAVPAAGPVDRAGIQSTLTTSGPDGSFCAAARVGAWELGEILYSSTNWLCQVVSHFRTGKAARLLQLKATGPLADQSQFIVAAAERASTWHHPYLVEVLDWGLHDGRAYVVSDAHGKALQELVDDDGPMEETEAIPFMAALADALAYLHGLGIVYQLLDPFAAVVGGDARSARLGWPLFGVPAGSAIADAAGRPQRFLVRGYAAPEVLSGQQHAIEPSVDLFGLGSTFCYLLAGRDTYFAARKEGSLPDLRTVPTPVTARFAGLIGRLTGAEPQRRPTALATRAELFRIAEQLGIAVTHPGDTGTAT
jgi:serine/threonine protein kinase